MNPIYSYLTQKAFTLVVRTFSNKMAQDGKRKEEIHIVDGKHGGEPESMLPRFFAWAHKDLPGNEKIGEGKMSAIYALAASLGKTHDRLLHFGHTLLNVQQESVKKIDKEKLERTPDLFGSVLYSGYDPKKGEWTGVPAAHTCYGVPLDCGNKVVSRSRLEYAPVGVRGSNGESFLAETQKRFAGPVYVVDFVGGTVGVADERGHYITDISRLKDQEASIDAMLEAYASVTGEEPRESWAASAANYFRYIAGAMSASGFGRSSLLEKFEKNPTSLVVPDTGVDYNPARITAKYLYAVDSLGARRPYVAPVPAIAPGEYETADLVMAADYYNDIRAVKDIVPASLEEGVDRLLKTGERMKLGVRTESGWQWSRRGEALLMEGLTPELRAVRNRRPSYLELRRDTDLESFPPEERIKRMKEEFSARWPDVKVEVERIGKGAVVKWADGPTIDEAVLLIERYTNSSFLADMRRSASDRAIEKAKEMVSGKGLAYQAAPEVIGGYLSLTDWEKPNKPTSWLPGAESPLARDVKKVVEEERDGRHLYRNRPKNRGEGDR